MKYRSIVMCCLVGVLSCLFPGHVFAQLQYDEVIVDFVDTASQADIDHVAKQFGITLVYNSIFSKHEELMRFPIGNRTPGEVAKLIESLDAEKTEIEFAEPNYLYQAYALPNDPMYAKQWNMRMINVEKAWDVATGEKAVVAVIDTGVAFEDYKDGKGTYHRVADLAKTKFIKGYDFVDDDEHPNDDNGHGTHVAGTIAQTTNNQLGVVGIAYNATIMPLKVLSRQGFGSVADIAEAIEYAADNGAHVINMSLGGPFPSKIMQEAVEYAHKKGVTIICAAGNESRNRASYPALYPYAIGVSSVGPDGELAPYSNYGEGIDIAAPGGNTRVNKEDGVLQNTIGRQDPTKDGYEYFQGTSMASPHVAGVAALIVSTGVKDPKKVEEILLKTTTKKGDQAKYGAGLVNAEAAVKAAKSGDISVPAATVTVTASPLKLKESMLYFIAGVGFALLYFKLLTRTDGWGKILSFLFSLAMFLASSGLFFLDFVPVPGMLQSVKHVISSPVPNLDRVLFGDVSAINPILHSMIIPLVLVIALLGTKRGKYFAIGFAVGMASHLFIDAFFSSANVAFIPGSFVLDKLWLILNSIACFGLAFLAGKEK